MIKDQDGEMKHIPTETALLNAWNNLKQKQKECKRAAKEWRKLRDSMPQIKTPQLSDDEI